MPGGVGKHVRNVKFCQIYKNSEKLALAKLFFFCLSHSLTPQLKTINLFHQNGMGKFLFTF